MRPCAFCSLPALLVRHEQAMRTFSYMIIVFKLFIAASLSALLAKSVYSFLKKTLERR